MSEKGVLCPTCKKNIKHWHSKQCQECYNKDRAGNPNSRFNRTRAKNPLYEKFLCPVCSTNYMTKNSKQCLSCLRKESRKGREGDQFCATCHCLLTENNWPNHRRKWWHRICNACFDERKSRQDVEIVRRKAVERTYNLKKEVMAAYGGKCQCCGESEIAFLTIDHKLEDGKSHVLVNKNGKPYRLNGSLLYKWLKDNGYPQDNYQCLCMNCNFAKSKNPGGCPHQLTKERLAERERVSEPFQHICVFCGKKLRNNGGLASHQRKYHAEEIERQKALQQNG